MQKKYLFKKLLFNEGEILLLLICDKLEER